MKGSGGCWSCRARRKKCDKKRPICEICSTLHITCHYGAERPLWMDGSLKQDAMADQLKREVKLNAHRRKLPAAEGPKFGVETLDRESSNLAPEENRSGGHGAVTDSGRSDCMLSSFDGQQLNNAIPLGRSEAVLEMFYLDHVFPFLYPFYKPDPIQEGGRAWLLELIATRPLLRQMALCHSSYFFNLLQDSDQDDSGWQKALDQTKNAFGTLKQGLNIINTSRVLDHLHGAVRVLTTIMQIQRFEIAAQSFENCRAHLDAGIALFQLLMTDFGALETSSLRLTFGNVLDALKESPPSSGGCKVPTAEQAAFRFSTALLVFDDIVASTITQQRPRLYEYHEELLCRFGGSQGTLDLEAVVGCQNWVLALIGEITALNEWQGTRRGPMATLMQRAKPIKESIQSGLSKLTNATNQPNMEHHRLPELLGEGSSRELDSQKAMITAIWAHAALLYLSLVVPERHSTNIDVTYHVNQVLELLSCLSTPALLRTAVWPFCIAGCLAQPAQENAFSHLVNCLQPRSVFGTVRKALEIMRRVWAQRDQLNSGDWKLGSLFSSDGELVLLV